MSLVLVWAGGSGMNALAQLFVRLALPEIVCIDQTTNANLEQLGRDWAQIVIGHGTYTLKPDDFVIYSAAVKQSPEVETAFAQFEENHLHVPPMLYAQFLGELSKYLYTIAISGTHGKSTTTALVATAAIQHLPDTALAIVGAGVIDREGNNVGYKSACSEYLQKVILHITSRKHNDAPQPMKQYIFVVEADEFNHHFLRLDPDVSIITTLDHDHVDTYPTQESYFQAFRQFVQNTHTRVFLLPEAAEKLALDTQQQAKVTIVTPGQFTFQHLLGGHNHANASLAQAAVTFVAYQRGLQLSPDAVAHTLETNRWLSRRAELIGQTTHHVPVFSDYGHHPQEINSTLLALKEKYPDKKITCLFQPHQARRLLEFRERFVEALQLADQRLVTPCYTAREQREEIAPYLPKQLQKLGSFDELTNAFAEQADAAYLRTDEEMIKQLQEIKNGVIIAFSAGDLDEKLRKIIYL